MNMFPCEPWWGPQRLSAGVMVESGSGTGGFAGSDWWQFAHRLPLPSSNSPLPSRNVTGMFVRTEKLPFVWGA
jgi:hypothetical protein